ncbi:hypothetical protein DRW07_11370 [Alteromonas sediminis]|uniref:Catalase n=1 Tax=Alteromonas sediminis TaxID=2259342 RepID=A0A3N5XZS5_9ALTE|nr:putative metalloprotease CJM1_0395 family protein [Alteromonas sediminis]RPJ66672.1 hypothetical protein DRW07_11370 [Alteromonas sediminis]
MNIVTPIPTTMAFPSANLSTESARRDNLLRETIPQTGNSEKGEPEKGLGSESDRARLATGQFSNPLVYERPSIQSSLGNQSASNAEQNKDNGSDESAGREEAEQRQQDQAEQREVRDLKARDREVRAHEQAHAAVGGQYAGSPQYEFETGPDGQRYAVGGRVSIDISEAQTPEATLQKMQQVRAAALAPANPSPQDLRVASEANQRAFEARSEILQNASEDVADNAAQSAEITPPSLDDIVDGNRISTPTRTLDRASLSEQQDQAASSGTTRTLSFDEGLIQQRSAVIAQFYANAVAPEGQGFSANA